MNLENVHWNDDLHLDRTTNKESHSSTTEISTFRTLLNVKHSAGEIIVSCPVHWRESVPTGILLETYVPWLMIA